MARSANTASKIAPLQMAIASVLDSLSGVLLLIDGQGVVRDAAGSGMQQLGLSRDVLAGRAIAGLKGVPMRRAHFQQALLGETVKANVPVREFQFETTYTPIQEDGRVVAVLCHGTDVTGRIASEIAFDEQQFESQAMSAIKALEESSGGVAHEVNNPLMIINGYCANLELQLRRRGQECARELSFVKGITDAARRIQDLTSFFTEFAFGIASDRATELDAESLARSAWTQVSENFSDDLPAFEVICPTGHATVYGRPTELKAAIFELLKNSIEACRLPSKDCEPPNTTHHDKGRVVIRVLTDGSQTVMRLSDSGPGIPYGSRYRVLMPFFTTKPVGSGKGLGLTRARRLIDRNHGTIELQYPDGQWEFALRLPAREG